MNFLVKPVACKLARKLLCWDDDLLESQLWREEHIIEFFAALGVGPSHLEETWHMRSIPCMLFNYLTVLSSMMHVRKPL